MIGLLCERGQNPLQDVLPALGLTKDSFGSRMGLRSKRYAALIENGKITMLNVDEKGMVNSSADAVLAAL
jgi:peroxiredoxin